MKSSMIKMLGPEVISKAARFQVAVGKAKHKHMKTTFKIIGMTFLVAMLATGGTFGQQLPQFSQYIFNGLHINPGYAGYKGEPYIQSTYRSQWMDFPGAPETFTVTADLSANEGTMGFGVSLMSDNLGPARTTSGLLTYAYRIQVGRESFLGMARV